LFFRTVMTQGDDGPDPAPAVALVEQTRVYPLHDMEKDVRPMEFPNASGRRVNMMYPIDSTYYDKLAAFVDHEPVEAITPELRGVLASIGIIKGRPFEPSVRQRELLEKAVVTAPKMIAAGRLLGRPDGRHLYYHDRQYLNAWAGATAEFMQDTYLDVDQRAVFFQIAYSSAPAMAMHSINAGAKYPFTFRDADGDLLNGSNHYVLRLPPDPPAKLFWAVTAYNTTDGTMPDTDQLFPSINQFNKVEHDDDGSIRFHFGPELRDGIPASNFIKTVPNRAFLVAIRFYGTTVEFYDQTWKPDVVVKAT
jgi:hypothetical protein